LSRAALVCAHRGGAGLAPENTLAAARKALDLGVDAVECDVRLSADARVMVIHDDTVQRTTNGAGRVEQMTADELRALDAGGGEPIPLLEELCELLHGKAQLVCEFKDDAAVLPALEAVRAAGMLAETTFISFDLRRLETVRAADPEATVSSLLWNPSEADIEHALRIGGGVDINYLRLSLYLAAVVQSEGMFLRAYTPNAVDHFDVLLRMGVDAITTDFPDLLIERLQA